MNLTPEWRRRFTRLVELLIIAAVLVAATTLWQWFQEGSFEPVYVAVGVLLAALWAARRWLKREGEPVSPATMPSLSPRSRENLLNHMQTAWIDGFLKQSLHNEVLKLTLHYRPDAVGSRPWQLTLREPGQPDAPVPSDRSLLALFTASGRSLLILGEPGSGKTITMLQLAERLIETARQDAAAPVPIILNLSSWAQAQKPLGEWMAEELFVQYGLSRDLARAAIAQNQFLYLLDGLDEVAAAARADCLAAINAFKEAHPAEMAVCSRVAEYEALQARLRMGVAIQIQPLSDTQIDAYLAWEGLELQATRATLAHDPDLRDLARAPLMLSLMSLAYRGLALADLQPLADKAARRRHLFDHYVQRMFARRPLPADAPYTQTQAVRWLTNLAQGMAQYQLSAFYIERLQPTWLKHIHQNLFNQVLLNLIGGHVELVDQLEWRTPSRQKVMLGLAICPLAWAFLWLFANSTYILFLDLSGCSINEMLIGWSASLIFGLLAVLALGSAPGFLIHIKNIMHSLYPNEGIRNSIRNALRMTLVLGLSGGLIGWVGTEPLNNSFERMHNILASCFETSNLAKYLWNGWRSYQSVYWVVFAGLMLGLNVGAEYGWKSAIKHYTLRWLLARADILPYPFRDSRLVAFLDAMHARILLRRVGGGWVFVHRSLLDYFASLAENAAE